MKIATLIEKQGDLLIKASQDAYLDENDVISKEIVKYQSKYGSKWFKHYAKATRRLAEKENKKFKHEARNKN